MLPPGTAQHGQCTVYTADAMDNYKTCLCLVAEEFPLASVESTMCKATLAGNSNTLSGHVHRRKLKCTCTHLHTSCNHISWLHIITG